MPEVLLNGSRVLAIACKLEPTRMPQHMWMDREGEFRELASARSSTPRIGWVDAKPFFNRLTCTEPALKAICSKRNTYREYEMALPRELSPEQRVALVERFVEQELGKTRAY